MVAARLGTLVLLLGTAACSSGPPNVYPLEQPEAVALLASVKSKPSGSAPFGQLVLRTTKKGADTVVWDATDSRSRYRCELAVTPLDETGSRVDLLCDGSFPGAGASEGIALAALRKRAIELVDATLENRPFDAQLAQGATASGWPENLIDHGTQADAAGQAVDMYKAARTAQ